MAELPDAGTKLRLVLDYLPCEACLAQPTADQDLLCTICARLDRQVAVRVGTRTTILVERPSPPEAPIVIPPATVLPTGPGTPRDIVVTLVGDASDAPPGSIEVIVEPLGPPAPLPVPLPVMLPPLPAEPAAAPAEEEPELGFDDIVSFVPARDEFFDYTKPAKAARSVPVEEEPREEPVRAEPEPMPEDDFVFRPPAKEEPAPAREEPVLADDVIPSEEVPVERPREEPEPWAPPPDFLAEEEPAPAPVDEQVLETEVIETQVEPEEEVLDMEVVEDEEVLEMEVVPDEPAPSGTGDLYRLRGFDVASEAPLAKVGIREVAHLAGHDAGDLASRTGLAFERLLPWIQVADLVHEVGVPLDAANALVAAGIAGPRGLADADPDEVADRVTAFGGYDLNAREVRRWKRRA